MIMTIVEKFNPSKLLPSDWTYADSWPNGAVSRSMLFEIERARLGLLTAVRQAWGA